MTSMPSLSRSDLKSVFDTSVSIEERVGIEIESAALDPRTGKSVPYDGPAGISAYLWSLLDEIGGHPLYDGQHLIGVHLPDGSHVSLEHGGAIELSSLPSTNLVDLVDTVRESMDRLAAVAQRRHLALVPGANYPFTTMREVHWVPHARGPLMRRHFDSLGQPGEWGYHVIAMTLSTQATFDYTSPTDFVEKLRMQVAVSTPASALFVNSPLEDGRPCGALSRRMQYWSRADPNRARIVSATLSDTLTVDSFIDWALTLPMMYRKKPDGSCARAPSTPFAALLVDGFDDGSRPDLSVWRDHLWQIISYVRVGNTLEVRAVDGPPYPAFAAVPAFWTGLTYHRPSRTVAWELLRAATLQDHCDGLDNIAQHGLSASFAGQPVHDVATRLLELSKAGLQARIDAGKEKPEALTYLQPLDDILATGSTFAEQCLDRWQNEFNKSPQRYVEAFQI